MKILIDTREQKALDFSFQKVERLKLPCGDYGCLINEEELVPIMFERKSIPDLFGSLSKGYKRFKAMLKRAKAEDIKIVIIIEGSLQKVLKGYIRSQRPGISIVKQLFSLRAIYDVDIIFCQNREEMAFYIAYCFEAYKRLKQVR